MKLKTSLTVILMLLSFLVMAQETEVKPKGKATAKVFFNYHLDLTEDVDQTSEFEIQRAYLGYKYAFNDKFSASVTLDAGKGDVSDYSVFVKQAQLDFKASKSVTLSFGVIGMKQFKDQEKFWGYRYIYKSFGDQYKFGTSADLGIMANFKLSSDLKLDVLIVNGEGYKKLQDSDGKHRVGANLVYSPSNWVFKGYFDSMSLDDTTVNNLAFFAGYKTNTFRLGAEYNMLQNGESYKSAAEDYELTGLSFYGTYNINKQWNVFGRYDDFSTNEEAGDINEGTILAGVEYRAIKGINTSLNYRTTNFNDSSINNESLVYVNLEFAF